MEGDAVVRGVLGFLIQTRDLQTLPLKGWVVNILGFAGQTPFHYTLQLCPCNKKAQPLNKWVCLCSSKTLFIKPGCELDMARGLSFSHSQKDGRSSKPSLSFSVKLKSCFPGFGC